METENACCETEPTEAVKTGEVHRVAKRPRGQFIMVYPVYAVYPQPHMCCLLIKRCFQTSEIGSKPGKQWIYKVIFKSLSSLRCLKHIKMCKMQKPSILGSNNFGRKSSSAAHLVEVAAEQRRQRGAFVHSSRMLNNVEHPTFTAFYRLYNALVSDFPTERH